MRVVEIPLPPHLPKKWNLSCTTRMVGVNACANGVDRSNYIKKHGSWGGLKNWLAKANDFKCWYCEAKSHRAPFDVDHFRPKLGVTIDGVKLPGHDGYWWLSYEWSNFRLSCQRCNRPEKEGKSLAFGKANEFPLFSEVSRCAIPAGLIQNEVCRLLDPCSVADCDLLAHGIDGEVKPAAKPGTWEYVRADYTIKKLGFNSWDTPKSKREKWQLLDLLIKLNGNHPDVVAQVVAHLDRDREYSKFLRASIGTHRDKPWIENLL